MAQMQMRKRVGAITERKSQAEPWTAEAMGMIPFKKCPIERTLKSPENS
jgi:hypothetical protein